jgi:hypothetical protein
LVTIILNLLGHVVLFIAEKLPVSLNSRLGLLLKYALSGQMQNTQQIEFAMKYLKEQGDKDITDKQFEESVGVI